MGCTQRACMYANSNLMGSQTSHRWTVPSSIPVSAFGGASLFGLLNASIATEMAHFPVGPALGDKFWIYLFTWHIGLFTTMLLGEKIALGRSLCYHCFWLGGCYFYCPMSFTKQQIDLASPPQGRSVSRDASRDTGKFQPLEWSLAPAKGPFGIGPYLCIET